MPEDEDKPPKSPPQPRGRLRTGQPSSKEDEGQERVRASYRENYDRLANIKQKYDPDNFFHVNQNIRPSPK